GRRRFPGVASRTPVRRRARAGPGRSNPRKRELTPSGHSPGTRACPVTARLMLSVVQGLVPISSALVARALAAAALAWALVGAPGTATADACAYASTGPNGTEAVAVAGSMTWPLPPKCSPPAPRPEEHTSEVQSRENLVCRLLLENINIIHACI